ncbi:MAG: Asp-tRNA(Asn)/Glu-tRNA(Gln) amidotransferase subunit GatC [Lachnospiraceae bacterium]|nr:Asp-tRNA(Asn)/Glu-tRNA(Gln) amidotransferase subunit GatC [Lachnospiraceae bacterium]
MKKRISNETIEYIGILSKLELDETEKEQAVSDIEMMLDFFDKMSELDTEDVDPMSHPMANNNVFREDVVTNGDMRKDMLKNAPMVSDGMFGVPKTFG